MIIKNPYLNIRGIYEYNVNYDIIMFYENYLIFVSCII
jgi:hypothetical protein